MHGRQEPIPFDYLIIATGSSYAFPAKVAEAQMTKAVELYKQLPEKIMKAEHILLIGGGPVGVELAAEIGTDFPGKKVTLVHNQPTLLRPGVFNEKLYPRLYEQLEKLGVQMILNDRIELPKQPADKHMNYIEGKHTFVTERTKQSITADLTFICVGAHVNNKSILNGALKSKINPQTGRLIVNNYLQVDGFENIFAVGDICDKEEKVAFLAGEQAKYISKLIPLIHQKKAYPKEYELHPNKAIFLSLGRNGGIGQLPTKGGMLIGMNVSWSVSMHDVVILGNFPMKMMKSKSMFAGRYRSALNYGSDTPSETKSVDLEKVHSIQSMLSLSEEEAQHFLAGLPVKDLDPGQDYIW